MTSPIDLSSNEDDTLRSRSRSRSRSNYFFIIYIFSFLSFFFPLRILAHTYLNSAAKTHKSILVMRIGQNMDFGILCPSY